MVAEHNKDKGTNTKRRNNEMDNEKDCCGISDCENNKIICNEKYIHPVYALELHKQRSSLFYMKFMVLGLVIVLMYSLFSGTGAGIDSKYIETNKYVAYEKDITEPCLVKIELKGKVNDCMYNDFSMLYDQIKDNDKIKGVILKIHSGGGVSCSQ